MTTEQTVSCHLLVTLAWQQQAGAHRHSIKMALIYEVCPESKDTKVLNMYNIFNSQKRHCEWIAGT